MNCFDIDIYGNVISCSSGSFEIIDNPGGGDCFFYSVIDSGILDNYEEFRNIENSRILVKLLRKYTVLQIKKDIEDGNIVSIYKDTNRWYRCMLHSSYWADDYMICALQKVLGIRIILIGDDGKIYSNSPYESQVKICRSMLNRIGVSGENDYVYTYNSIEMMKKDNTPFIIIWYRRDVHFEIVVYEDEMTIFNGYESLRKYVPNLLAKYIEECKLITIDNSYFDILKDLRT